MPHVMGSIEVYEQQTTYPVILESSEVVVLWGLHLVNTLKIALSSTDCAGLEFFDQLKQPGKAIIAIDPIRSETIEFFGENAQWIAPHPMTDVAMMIGIAHSLVKKGKHDKAFLDKYTTGFDKFEAYLMGQEDGVEKNSQWASEICGVPAEQLDLLADIFIQNRTMLIFGWGMQRQQYSEQRHWMIATLAAMLGQIGDLVRAFIQRGQVLVGAEVTDIIKQGSVCIHEAALPDFDKQAGLCKNGGCNVLTLDIPTSRLANGCAANSALVRIAKYTGEALKLTAFEPTTIC